METVMPTAKPPLRQRVNVKLIVLLAIVALPFVWFFCFCVSEFTSGGVHARGDYAEVDLKALGHFRFDDREGTVGDVPERFRKLDGKRVAMEGKMFSRDQAGPTVD